MSALNNAMCQHTLRLAGLVLASTVERSSKFIKNNSLNSFHLPVSIEISSDSLKLNKTVNFCLTKHVS